MKHLLLTALILSSISTWAQETADSAGAAMEEVVVRAFDQNRRLHDVPAAIHYLDRNALSRFGTASVVQAVNTVPGVRMEERSPGSYRINIRGSSLRSPFGVRNVKVYYNDLPFTGPGGQTYLNQLGVYNFHSLEIIKGPGSSLYGAGTGGVMLIEGLSGQEAPGAAVEGSAGSYGLRNLYATIVTGPDRATSRVSFQRQQSDGYRDHSALKRDVHSWTGNFRLNGDAQLKTTFLYGDLFYETPGALTKAEYEANPKAARPGSGGSPGSVAAQASIRQHLFLAGASYTQILSRKWQNKSLLYGMFTELRNPTLRNYSKSSEPSVGGRSTFQFAQPFRDGALQLSIGAEWQQGFNSVAIHDNVGGRADTLRSTDEIRNRVQFAFVQTLIDLKTWTLTAGASVNQARLRFERFEPSSDGLIYRHFPTQVLPRLALMKKFGNLHVYSSFSRGFSPPTVDELLPTGSAVNLGLNAEEGNNYDAGLKTTIAGRLTIDINAFLFSLDHTIAQRRDASGGDYYVNSGSTRQHGVETYIGYAFPLPSLAQNLLWFSHTWHHFRYGSFKQLNSDFSGNQMPGEAPHTISAGFDLLSKSGWSGTLSYFFSGRIPLDDANSAYANAYHLISLRTGYQIKTAHRWLFRLSAGIDNLLDQQYSLGNDINGFGGRYYNAAPGRNYFATLLVQWYGRKENR